MTDAVNFYVPSYLDLMDVDIPGENFKALADSMAHFGPLRFRHVKDEYTIRKKDMDWCLRLDQPGVVYVPEDSGLDDEDFPIGAQVAVLNNTAERVLVRGIGGVQIIGADRNVIDKWRVGVLVKNGANFWLLSLGSGAGGNSKPVPSEPKLTKAQPGAGVASLAWDKPTDDGGTPLTSYVVEVSVDGGKNWKINATLEPTVLTYTVQGLGPVPTSFRVKASNENGFGEPSNVLTATPTILTLEVKHTGLGEFTILNKSDLYAYTVTVDVGTATITGSVVTMDNVNSTATLTEKYVPTGAQIQKTLIRKAYTYHQGPPQCHSISYQCVGCPCGGGGCDCNSRGCTCACTSYSSGECAGLCGYQRCDCDGCPQIKDATPAGYDDEFGEWVRIA